MALDRQKAESTSLRGPSDAKEKRELFPLWALIVIAGCAAVWLCGAKLYLDRMAAYESYVAPQSWCWSPLHLLERLRSPVRGRRPSPA